MDERRVCIYGTASTTPEYVRNRLLLRALEQSGNLPVYCSSSMWAGTSEKIRAAGGTSPRVLARVLFTQMRLFFRYLFRTPDHAAVLVLAPGHVDIPMARLGSWIRGKPLVFDAFYSLYDTVVLDRALVPASSIRARLVSLLDRAACRAPDRALVDTMANRDFICRRYGIDPSRLSVIPAGAPDGFEESAGAGAEDASGAKAGTFTVLFQGSYVPLQGTDTIVRAAAILKDRAGIRFRMIGTGQTRGAAEAIAASEGLQNIEFVDWMSLEQLKEETGRADACLGIFGPGGKAGRVIPHKVHAALAMGKPVITADTPAARELLVDGVNAALCPPGDPAALAAAIVSLEGDAGLRRQIGAGGRMLFDEQLSARRISEGLEQALGRVLGPV
jgi:glycosyltransferase involved in cell wall biosynthesis